MAGAGTDRGDAARDAVRDGRAAATAMRRADPPWSYARIAGALGVSRSTAYRWANPEAFEYDRIRSRKPGGRLAVRDAARLDELRERAARRRPCRRCGAARDEDDGDAGGEAGGAEEAWDRGPGAGGGHGGRVSPDGGAAPEDGACWRCRLVEGHARAARRVLRLVDRGVPERPVALRAADPVLRDVDVDLVLRQLRAIGRLEAPGVTTDDLAHREVVQGLADGRPTAVGALDAAERGAAVVAAGCLVAVRDEA